MTESGLVFIGVDVTAGKRPLTYAILDQALNVKQVGDATYEALLKVILKYERAICAIDAPGGKNKKLLYDPDYRKQVGLIPDKDRYQDYRVCEYELRRRRIGIYGTPPDDEKARQWVKLGWKLYDRLREEGFVDYPEEGERRLMEVYPHASFTVLINARPYSKSSFEGLLQRQLILYEVGIEVPDPMKALEEWTRIRLLKGLLDKSSIYTHDQLDALIAAYTGYLADRKPRKVSAVGDAAEGQIIVPTAELKDLY